MVLRTPTFKPAWWCPGAHAQTIMGALFRRGPHVTLERKRLETPDGDFLDLDFLGPPASNKKSDLPLVVILHGLEGSSQSPYVQNLLSKIQSRGWRAVAINMRMCSGEPNRLKQTYHSGKTEDLDLIIRELAKICPREKLMLVGYSIGGNIVLKWLGEQETRGAGLVHKAVVVSVPYDLMRSVEVLDRGFNREVYTRALLGGLKKKLAAKKKKFPNAIRYDQVEGCNTFTVFDREATAPLNGFKDEQDYWKKSSSKHFLKSIGVRTLLIHAEDDPFFPGRFLPLGDIDQSKFLEILLLPHGGHVGFVSGPAPWKQTFWLEDQILDFFKHKILCPTT